MAASELNNGGDRNKVAISMGILVVVIAVIIVAVWFTNRIRPPAIIPLSVRNQRRREDELYRKEMGHFILESLPVVRYSSRLQSNARRASSTDDPCTRPLQCASDVEPNESNEKSLQINDNSAAIDQVKSNHSSTSDDKTTKGRYELPNEDQQTSREGSMICSVCTEDFAENDRVRILPCGHIYHRRCIDPWLLRFGGNCPLW